jgi:hypothetical protein
VYVPVVVVQVLEDVYSAVEVRRQVSEQLVV